MLQKLWKLTCTDLILTNQPALFQNSTVLETGLSDFYLFTVFKLNLNLSFQKCKPHIITDRIYKNYDNDAFRSEIQSFYSLNDTDGVNILHLKHVWLLICCEIKLKKNFFFWKDICVFYKIYIICRKKCF